MPNRPPSAKMHSHRTSQGAIYVEQLRESGLDVTFNTTGNYHTDYNEYDEVYLYHGNDWSGALNMFGGTKDYGFIYNIKNLSHYHGKIYSLVIDCPKYSTMIKERIDNYKNAGVEYSKEWDDVDFENMSKLEDAAITIDPNMIVKYPKIAIGDSHAICMYRPGYMNVSTPFKTLHGAIKSGFDSFIPEGEYTDIETYFGNIDVRHHLMRQPDPEKATIELAINYVAECERISKLYDVNVKIWELLPIENESRKLPKTGYYNKTPFYGTWIERDNVRKLFRDTIASTVAGNPRISILYWTDSLLNKLGELDFAFMERPQSVHLSRSSYPFWTGDDQLSSLKDFFTS